MESPGTAMPPGYRHGRKKSWTPAQGQWHASYIPDGAGENSVQEFDSRAQTQDEHIRNRAPSTASFRGTDDTTVNDDGAGTASYQALESRHTMSSISIIGLGGMTRAIGGGATAGTFGTAPAGDIVILAVPYASAAPVVAQYGDALAGKVIIDISNTFNPTRPGLAT